MEEPWSSAEGPASAVRGSTPAPETISVADAQSEAPDVHGMGRHPSGPTFTPWQPQQSPGEARRVEPVGVDGDRPSPLAAYRAPRSRVPALVTALVVLLVSAVVVTATVVANRAPLVSSAPTPITVPTRAAAPQPDDSIEFQSSEGSGRLVVLNHTWTAGRAVRPKPTTALRVEVELVCTAGEIRYDPNFFQAFDAEGRLFDVVSAATTAQGLDSGTLSADQRISGYLMFEIPRGEVTLLMTDNATQTVTALRIPH